MKRNGTRRPMALLLTAILCILSLSPVFSVDGTQLAQENTTLFGTQPVSAATGKDVKALLEPVTASVEQDGQKIPSGQAISWGNPMTIAYHFKVPVLGDDGMTSSAAVQGGDQAVFALPDGLKLTSALKQTIMFENTTVGAVTFSGTSAAIVFDAALTDPGINNVVVTLKAEMKFDPNFGGGKPGVYDIVILDKTFQVTIPVTEPVITGTKAGIVDLSRGLIDWTVEVQATGGTSSGALQGYTFCDDLKTRDIGTYIADSFQVGTTTGALTVTNAGLVYTTESGILTYAFSEAAVGECYLSFQTKLSDARYYNTRGAQTITNVAQIKNNQGKEAAEFTGAVTFQMDWITKAGIVVPGSDQGTDGAYDPSKRRIEWSIQANQEGLPLDKAVITDVLPAGLRWESATLQEWKNNQWVTPAAITFTKDATSKGAYELGTITTPVLLTIRTTVLSTDPAVKVEQVENTANISWKGGPKRGLTGNKASVSIGIASITKTNHDYVASAHTLDWTVTVDTKKQPFNKLRVLDLLVYAESGFDVTSGTTDFDSITDNTSGGALSYVSNEDIAKLKPSYSQRYETNSFRATNPAGLMCTVHTLKKDGKAVADLLVITGTTDSGISAGLDCTKENRYTYTTKITNPDLYGGSQPNSGPAYQIKNTASLFSQNALLSEAVSTRNITSHMLRKDMMTRESGKKLLAALASNTAKEVLDAVNEASAGDARKGFDYGDKSALFKIYVNGDGLGDVTNDLTCTEGVTLGSLTLKEQLPPGWELQKLQGEDFLLYEGTTQSSFAVKATTPVTTADYQTFLKVGKVQPPTSLPKAEGGSLSFTFTKLEKPYVILIKAGPTKETAQGYFSQNQSYTVKNEVTLENQNYKKQPSDYELVTLTSTLLGKTMDATKADREGYLTWTVAYQPYALPHGATAFVEDTLPLGVDLPTDSFGTLLLTGSGIGGRVETYIEVKELALSADGTYKPTGSALDLSQSTLVTYDNLSRVLKFQIPDTEKAYALTYRTDITGMPGPISNKVKLSFGVAGGADASAPYTISNSQSGATLTRSGWLMVTKKDPDGKVLAGATFTLFAQDGTTVIRKGVTGADGNVYLKVIPEGAYILKETQAPKGYVQDGSKYVVTVDRQANGTFKTEISGNTGADSNKMPVINQRLGTMGNLTITKQVSGNAAQWDKAFSFTVALSGAGVQYPYAYTGVGVPDGAITGSQSAVFLSHGQSITLLKLPKELHYTVTEADYSKEGYSVTKTGDQGEIRADETAQAVFVNERSNGGGGSQPKPTEPPTEPTKPIEPIIPPIEPVVPPVVSPLPQVPVYKPEAVPNPNRPDSPSSILVIDENGVPLGKYERHEKSDGTFEYIDENGVPLGFLRVPQTGDEMPVGFLMAVMIVSLCAGVGLLFYRKKS